MSTLPTLLEAFDTLGLVCHENEAADALNTVAQAHDALVEALTELLDTVDPARDFGGWLVPYFIEPVTKARAALKLAGGDAGRPEYHAGGRGNTPRKLRSS